MAFGVSMRYAPLRVFGGVVLLCGRGCAAMPTCDRGAARSLYGCCCADMLLGGVLLLVSIGCAMLGLRGGVKFGVSMRYAPLRSLLAGRFFYTIEDMPWLGCDAVL